MIELEIHHFATPKLSMELGKGHQWMFNHLLKVDRKLHDKHLEPK